MEVLRRAKDFGQTPPKRSTSLSRALAGASDAAWRLRFEPSAQEDELIAGKAQQAVLHCRAFVVERRWLNDSGCYWQESLTIFRLVISM
jgi:hypothetical protein